MNHHARLARQCGQRLAAAAPAAAAAQRRVRRAPPASSSTPAPPLSRGSSGSCAPHYWVHEACGVQALHRRRAASGSAASSSADAADAAVAVVIVDHGSRKKESNDMLLEFVALYKQLTGRALVEPAHMELAEPSIEQAVARCAAAGARRVVIAPYFLSRGRHVQHDIPALAAQAAATHPGVECVVADPIGIDSLMAQLIDNRVRAAAQHGAAVDPAAAAASGTAAMSSGSSGED